MADPLGFWSIAAEDPHRLAVVDPQGRCTTFGELAELTNRYTHGMRSLGLTPGDSMATVLPNGLEQLVSLLAAYQGGLYVTPVNWHLSAAEIAYILNDSDTGLLIGHERFATELERALDGADVPHAFSVGTVAGFRPLEDLTAGRSSTRPENLTTGSIMGYTSGTTGRPKGVRRDLSVRHPDESAGLAGLLLMLFGIQPHADNVFLCATPVYHSAGSLWVTMSLHLGHSVVLMDRWSPLETLELIERHRVTHTHLVPTMFHRLLRLPAADRDRYDVSSLRHVIHAAAPCPVETKQQMLDWWGDCIYEYYASTEGGGTLATPADWRRFPGTVGRPWPETEVIVVDPDGPAVPGGGRGALFMKVAPSLRFEYHKDETKTAGGRLGEFFTVGDIGYFNEEGYLFLNDRARDMIIVGGVNIYPAEIEGVMQQCPLVGDVAVFGVPDEDLGEAIKAVVEPAPGVEAGETTRREIMEFLQGRLARQRHPHSLDFSDALPREPTGKLFKRRLRDPYWEGRERPI